MYHQHVIDIISFFPSDDMTSIACANALYRVFLCVFNMYHIEVSATIHGVLRYKRPGADQDVQWDPPSALRRIDVILVDEASQYDNKEWVRFMQAVAEQPHLPYVVAVADFQQLQPVVSGGHCQTMLNGWPRIDLDTVYRTSDAAQLLFLNRVRERQPTRQAPSIKRTNDNHNIKYCRVRCNI